MDSRLLLPLSVLAGMDVEGLHVHNERDGLSGVIVETEMGLRVYCSTEGDGDLHDLDNDEWRPSLDVSATRDRAARWLARRVGLECGSTAPEWRAAREPKPRGWILAGGAWFVFGPGRSLIDLEVPALAELDPADNTLLPDGSRLVDALALAAVCRAVGAA